MELPTPSLLEALSGQTETICWIFAEAASHTGMPTWRAFTRGVEVEAVSPRRWMTASKKAGLPRKHRAAKDKERRLSRCRSTL